MATGPQESSFSIGRDKLVPFLLLIFSCLAPKALSRLRLFHHQLPAQAGFCLERNNKVSEGNKKFSEHTRWICFKTLQLSYRYSAKVSFKKAKVHSTSIRQFISQYFKKKQSLYSKNSSINTFIKKTSREGLIFLHLFFSPLPAPLSFPYPFSIKKKGGNTSYTQKVQLMLFFKFH